MAAAFPPSDPDTAELSTCGEEADSHLGEDMEEEEDFTVQLGTTYLCRRADGTYHDAEVVKMRTNKRAKREEYMVRYVGATRRQTEWVDKSRLLLKPEEDDDEEEDAEEGSDQEMFEHDQTLEYQKPDEDEPETKKAKVETEDAANSSVISSGDFAEELTCLLCSKLYEDPVMIECGHNFCRSCVDEAWAGQVSFACPDCKEAITEKSYSTNRALANLVRKAAGAPGIVALITPVQKQKDQPVKNCPEHEEKLKLYCKNDGTLSCIICQDSLKHVNHSFLPILEAEELYRAQLSGLINPLEEALTRTKELAVQYSESIEQHKPTLTEYRHKVVSDFEKLNNFLLEQKEKMLEQLQEQSLWVLQEMEINAAKMEENRDHLREALAEANERVNDSNSISFLTGMTAFLKKVKEQRKEVVVSQDALDDKELCRGTFKGPVQYSVWKQMKSIIGPIPECDEQPASRNEEAKEKPLAPPVPKDSVTAGDQQSEPEESDEDQEEAAQGPEDSSDLWSNDMDLGKFPDWMYKGRKEIWIIGDGYINSASREIEKGPYGYNLGLPHPNFNVRWLSNIKFWSALLPKLKKEFVTHRRPNIILIHVGTADLERKASDSLNNFVINYLADVSREFRRVDIVLSTLLPKKEWLGNSRDNFRKSFNSTLCQLAGKRRLYVAQHDELEKVLTERFKNEGGESYLNTSECNMFVKSMRNAVMKVMMKGSRNVAENNPEQQKTVPADGTSAKPNQTPAKNELNSDTNSEQQQSPMEIEMPLQGPANPPEPINVWLVGNAYISRAHRHAEKQPYGENLGIRDRYCSIRWLGRTTRWNSLVTEMKKSFVTVGAPSIIFLHIGTDDLEAISYDALINDMRNSLARLSQLFPKVKFILSTVLPTVEWMASPLEECRMMFNTRLINYAEKHGFPLVKFYQLEMKLLTRFRGKDRHSFLSATENDMFITAIKDYVLIAMLKNNQTFIKK